METIFDHNVTDAELVTLLGSVVSRENYLSFPLDPDGENGMLFSLYSVRGDTTKAKQYLAKVKDKLLRFNLQQNDIIVAPDE